MNNINILIIEQSYKDANNLEKSIQSMGFNVVEKVFNAACALKIIEKNLIDVVICDIGIAGECDGLCLAEQIELNYASCIIFLVNDYSDAILGRLAKTQHSSIICKPFKKQDIEIALKMAGLKHNSRLLEPVIRLSENIYYNKFANKVYRGRDHLQLTKKEHQLLRLLVLNKGVCSFELVNQIWDDKMVGEGTRRMLLYKLKRKIPELNIITHKKIGLQLCRPQKTHEI